MITIWAAYELMHKKMADNIVVNIEFKQLDAAEGFCIWSDDNLNPREFDIEINKTLKGDDFDTCIMHEMVHVLQWERGTWKGEGEREASQLQFELADDFWRCNGV